jgi:hypothetical protein
MAGVIHFRRAASHWYFDRLERMFQPESIAPNQSRGRKLSFEKNPSKKELAETRN